MAIINCPECDGNVSDKAKFCPKCGFPIAEKLTICPECEKRIFDEVTDCPDCGFPFDEISSGNENIFSQKEPDIVIPASTPPPPAGNQEPQPPAPVSRSHQNPRGNAVNDGRQRSTEIAQGMGAAMAMHKSYVGASFGVLALYLLFYPIGLVLNLIWMHEAGRIQKQTGVSPSGSGCLSVLFAIFFVIPVLAGIVFLIMILAGVAQI